MNLLQGVGQPLFKGQKFTLVSASRRVCTELRKLGLNVHDASSASALLSDGIHCFIVVAARDGSESSLEHLHSLREHIAVLEITCAAFDDGFASISYILNALRFIDFEACSQNNRNFLDAVINSNSDIIINSHNTALNLSLEHHLEFFAPKTNSFIPKGEWVSLSQFLECALIPSNNGRCFTVNGSFCFDGVAMATHQDCDQRIRDKLQSAWLGFKELQSRSKGRPSIHVEDNLVTKILDSNGTNYLPEIIEYVDGNPSESVIEVGFASSRLPVELDWKVNSPLNEGGGGIHLAIGSGVSGAHIDFISVDAYWEFSNTDSI